MNATDSPALRKHHALYLSLDDLLAPETLGVLEGREVTDVRVRPIAPPAASASGSRFLEVETGGEHGRRYIVKRISPAWDWIMRASGDSRGREVRLWQYGLADLLPAEVVYPVVACADNGDPSPSSGQAPSTGSGQAQWAILMHDVSDSLFPPVFPVTPSSIDLCVTDLERILDAMAAVHARF